MKNPFITPLWITCVLAIMISMPVDILSGTLWGLLAWIPWLILFVFSGLWIRERTR